MTLLSKEPYPMAIAPELLRTSWYQCQLTTILISLTSPLQCFLQQSPWPCHTQDVTRQPQGLRQSVYDTNLTHLLWYHCVTAHHLESHLTSYQLKRPKPESASPVYCFIRQLVKTIQGKEIHYFIRQLPYLAITFYICLSNITKYNKGIKWWVLNNICQIKNT